MLGSIKRLLLPAGAKYRKIRFGPAAGCTMLLDLRANLRLYLGLYERELVPHFKRLARPGYKCFDVGGNGGYDALMLAKLSGGPVVSFECDPAAAQQMRYTFARNPYPIQTVEAFVGARSAPGFVTLDQAASEHFVPDLIKMDIEGAEDDALEGAAHLLATRRPAFIIEVHSVEDERRCLEILRGSGYHPLIVDQRAWWREYRPLAHNRWLVADTPSA